MVLPHHNGPIAEWIFKDGSVQQLTWSELERALTSCTVIASILYAHKLLFPNHVRLSQWMRAGEYGVAQSYRVDKADINISVHSLNSFVDVFSAARLVIDSEAVYPLTIEILGSGEVITNQGTSLVDDLVWIRAITLDILSISVGTQSDIWLPFSLKGEPQYDVYQLNSNRLTFSLQEIQKETGFQPEEGVESDYSVIRGFHLDNVHYADGSIADVS